MSNSLIPGPGWGDVGHGIGEAMSDNSGQSKNSLAKSQGVGFASKLESWAVQVKFQAKKIVVYIKKAAKRPNEAKA